MNNWKRDVTMESKTKRLSEMSPGDHVWFEGSIETIRSIKPATRDILLPTLLEDGSVIPPNTVPAPGSFFVSLESDEEDSAPDVWRDGDWAVPTADEVADAEAEAEANRKPSFVTRCIEMVVAGRAPCDQVQELVNEFYAMPGNETGGSLHFVLNECNVENFDIEMCINIAIQEADTFGKWLGRVLRMMSPTQRKKLGSNLSRTYHDRVTAELVEKEEG